jgi:hypothetical protein
MAAVDGAVAAQPEPHQDVAAKTFDERGALACLAARRRGANCRARGTGGQPFEDLLDQRQRLPDLLDAHPHPRVHVALPAHGRLEREPRVGRISRLLACIERAPRGAADEAAGAVLARQLRLENAGGHGAVLQRGGAVIELDQLGKAAAHGSDQGAQAAHAGVRQIADNAAGHHPVHHQAVAEAGLRHAQGVLAQNAAVRMHQRERRVVADGADIAEVVGDPLQLRHQRAQPRRAWRRLHAECRFCRLRKGDGIGHRAVARDAARQPCRLVEGGSHHQVLGALVHVAQRSPSATRRRCRRSGRLGS